MEDTIGDGVFDISAYNASGGTLATYADLAAALGSSGANVPEGVRKGGMSVKYVQSSDNKYVQYLYHGTSTAVANFTNVGNWEKINLEEEVSQLGQKLIKLAKWGDAGNPTDLVVGDIYTSDGDELLRVDAIEGGVVTAYTRIPFLNGAIYTLYDELYIYNGTRLIKANRVIELAGIGTAATTSGVTAAGQLYFNTNTHSVWRCYKFNTTPGDSNYVEMHGLANTETLYLCKGSIFYFNGSTLVSTVGKKIIPSGDKLSIDDDYALRNVALDENYGLQIGYQWRDRYIYDQTRISTKLINALTKDVRIKVASDSFEIRGYIAFDANYSWLEYVTDLGNRKLLTLTKGYYYSVIFSKTTSSANITPDEIAPYVWVDDRITLNEIANGVSPLMDISIDVATLSENNAWYTGTDIGGTLTKNTYTDCYALKYPVSAGQVYELSAKGGSSGRAWYCLDAQDKIIALSISNFNSTIKLTIPTNTANLIIQSNAGIEPLSLKLLGVVSKVVDNIDELQNDVAIIEEQVSSLDSSMDSFKCLTPFVWNKLSRMKNQEAGFCNIGFIGDSWTQGTQNTVDGIQSGYAGYVEPLAKLLQDEYGFGGLGWLDFAIDEGSPSGAHKMFGCADLYKHWTYQFSGTVTGLDGSNNEQAPNCLGICCAHTIFSNGSSLSLTFNTGYLDRFILRYYKNAHFTISVNGGSAVEVTANADDGWQEQAFGTTGTDTTSVVINVLADDTIIFGMDCFYGTKGVRCHKIGNRSIKASNYLLMNAEQWETGISLLGLCWASVLLAINDLGGSTSESTINTIVTNISNLINRLKVATDDGNGLVTCDINVLGVENIERTTYIGLGALAKKQKAMALTNGYGWCSTDKCIGSKKSEFAYNGTFSDQIHLNKIGSYAYAKHIYDTLFDF